MFKIIKSVFSTQPKKTELDADIMEVIKKITPNAIEIIFDIGAHHGRYTDLVLRNFPKANLYLFEPFPKSFDVIIKKYNSSNITIENLALSNITETAKFYSNKLDETNSLLPAKITHSNIDELTKQIDLINVEVITLNYYWAEKAEKIDLLKIDAQGNTLNVLLGGEKLLEKGLIGIIHCEVEFIEIYKDQSLYHHVSSYLESFGYELFSLYNLHYDINDRLSWADALFQKVK